MCLAPCFRGCSDEEYRAEVSRVQAYFDTGGESLVREISQQRDAASANLKFEDASALHTRLDKLKPVLSQLAGIVHRIDHLAGVMVQKSASLESVNFFRIEAGHISGPLTFPIQSAEHAKSQSMESRVQAALALFPEGPASTALETMEHLALLKRWYYRSTRAGEIFFADEKGDLPLRRMVRGIARVSRGEKEADALKVVDPSPGSGEQSTLQRSLEL
jgi:excinuclease ABC subunit C